VLCFFSFILLGFSHINSFVSFSSFSSTAGCVCCAVPTRKIFFLLFSRVSFYNKRGSGKKNKCEKKPGFSLFCVLGFTSGVCVVFFWKREREEGAKNYPSREFLIEEKKRQ
jgi:hypothetical protein